jgi:transcriptional regulator with XRE-family HTH domain
MKRKGLNTSSLAKALGMNRPTLVHILSGRNKPNLQLIQQLALFDPELDLRELLTGLASTPLPKIDVPSDKNEVVQQVREVKTEVKMKLLVLNSDGTYNSYVQEA